MSSDKSLAALAFVCVVLFLRLPERLFYTHVSVCAGLLNCSPLSEEESAGSHRIPAYLG